MKKRRRGLLGKSIHCSLESRSERGVVLQYKPEVSDEFLDAFTCFSRLLLIARHQLQVVRSVQIEAVTMEILTSANVAKNISPQATLLSGANASED